MNRAVRYLLSFLSLGLLESGLVQARETLRFHPADSVTYRVTGKSVTTNERELLDITADTTRTVTDYCLKRTDTGWVLESVLRSMEIRPGSDSLKKSLSELLIGIRTLLYINAAGKAIRATGYEPLTARLDSLASPTVKAVFRQVLSPSALASKAVNDWNLRIDNLSGRLLQVGLIEYNSSNVGLKDGAPWSLLTANRFGDTLRIEGVLCQKITLFADSDPRRLAEGLGKSVSEIGGLFRVSDSVLTAMENQTRAYHSRLTITVEVGTLLERAEQLDRVVTLAVPGIDGKESMRRSQETVEKEIAYH